MIDLHAHTTASDGEHSPAELVAIAARAGVTVLGVTDHDTVAGVAEAQAHAVALGLTVVPGIEVSARHNGREVHVLGHFVDPTSPTLLAHVTRLHGERQTRMAEMVKKVQRLGIPLTLENVEAVAGGSLLTRPHLARALLALGVVGSVREAFDRFIGDGKAAFVPNHELPVEAAVRLIVAAGGVPTLAHPGPSRIERHELEQMAAVGLRGLEVDHLDHPPSQRDKFRVWTQALRLIPTAGTDFHGRRVAPQRLFGKLDMSRKDFAELKAASRGDAAH